MENKTKEDAIKELKNYPYKFEDFILLVHMMSDSNLDVDVRLWILEGLLINPKQPLHHLINKMADKRFEYLQSRKKNTEENEYTMYKKAFQRNHTLGTLFYLPLDHMPLYINRGSHPRKIFSDWRLKIGK